jgi:hypothetical protein
MKEDRRQAREVGGLRPHPIWDSVIELGTGREQEGVKGKREVDGRDEAGSHEGRQINQMEARALDQLAMGWSQGLQPAQLRGG